MAESTARIRSFWNAAAKRNPFWYVSSYRDFAETIECFEFWESGYKIWADLKRATGYTPTPRDTVVEIGCGLGRLTRAISPDVQQVYSLDVSDEMLGHARRHPLPNVTWLLGDGFTLPLPDATADCVLAYCVFQHLPSLEALSGYIREMCRAAKPGGVIAFTLVKRDRRDSLMALMRARSWIRERFSRTAAPGVWRREWVGIRPTAREVLRMAPLALQQTELYRGWLFYGRTASAGAALAMGAHA